MGGTRASVLGPGGEEKRDDVATVSGVTSLM